MSSGDLVMALDQCGDSGWDLSMQSGWDRRCRHVRLSRFRLLRLQGPKNHKKTYVSDRMLGPQTSPCQTRVFSFFFSFFFWFFSCFQFVSFFSSCILVDCWHISGLGIGSDSFWWRVCGTVRKLKYFWCRDKWKTVPNLRDVTSGWDQDLVLEVIPFDEEFVDQFRSWNLWNTFVGAKTSWEQCQGWEWSVLGGWPYIYIYIHCKLPSRAGDTVQEREVWNVLVKILALVTDFTDLLGALWLSSRNLYIISAAKNWQESQG